MSLDKAIESGKEKRKAYRKAKAVDPSCRNHGSCPACRGSRLRKRKPKKVSTEEIVEESEEGT